MTGLKLILSAAPNDFILLHPSTGRVNDFCSSQYSRGRPSVKMCPQHDTDKATDRTSEWPIIELASWRLRESVLRHLVNLTSLGLISPVIRPTIFVLI